MYDFFYELYLKFALFIAHYNYLFQSFYLFQSILYFLINFFILIYLTISNLSFLQFQLLPMYVYLLIFCEILESILIFKEKNLRYDTPYTFVSVQQIC